MVGKELLEAAEGFLLVAVGHHKGVRQSAEGRNAKRAPHSRSMCLCSRRCTRHERRAHGLGPVGAATAELDNAASPGCGDQRAALDAIMVWKVSVDSRKVSTICASMMGPVTRSRGSSLKRACLRERPKTSTRKAEGF